MVNFQGWTSTHNGGKQFVRYAVYSIYGRHFEKQNGGKKEKKKFLLISTISMGQHNNYYAKVCFLPFQSQDPSPPLKKNKVEAVVNISTLIPATNIIQHLMMIITIVKHSEYIYVILLTQIEGIQFFFII